MTAVVSPPPPMPLRKSRQYRVSWRRVDWAATTRNKTKTFPTEDAAVDFAQQLRGPWEDASPVGTVTIHVRTVGPWTPYEGKAP